MNSIQEVEKMFDESVITKNADLIAEFAEIFNLEGVIKKIMGKSMTQFADYLVEQSKEYGKPAGLKAMFEVLFGTEISSKQSDSINKLCKKNKVSRYKLLAICILKNIDDFWIFKGHKKELREIIINA